MNSTRSILGGDSRAARSQPRFARTPPALAGIERRSMSLILDKITMPAETPRVSRARLLEVLNESVSCCNSTVIAGRTGAGKTLLATDFAARCGRRVAWYKVDASEVELGAFLRYLIAAVGSQHPGFGRKTLALLASGAESADAALAAESFVYEMTMLEAGESLLIVIDDLHLVYDADWVVPFFARLLPLLPAETHVVLMGRTLPPAPLWRMRSKQTLRVIDEAALAFTPAEAEELFASYALPTRQAAQALAETWGRAAALDAVARGGQSRAEENASQPVTTFDGRARDSQQTNAQQSASQLRLVKGYSPKSSAACRGDVGRNVRDRKISRDCSTSLVGTTCL
jgi:ATP/maltotriose-dependent transcriptional regulator MalT